MNYLVWGTGEVAKNFIDSFWVGYFSYHSIVAFVDNNKNKVGQTFFQRLIISPSMIQNYSFDRILICSTYEREITDQITGVLGLDKKVIINRDMLMNEYGSYMMNKVQNKKVLVIGDRVIYRRSKAFYEDLFCICGVMDVHKLQEVRNYYYDYILLMNLMRIGSLDRTVGTIGLEKQTIDLLQQYGVNKENILTEAAYLAIRHQDRYISLGEENADKIFFVTKVGGTLGLAGMASIVSKNVLYAQEKGYIPVVDSTSQNQYLEQIEVGKVNAWEKFFEQPAGYGMEDIKNSKNVIFTQNNKNIQLPSTNSYKFLKMKPDLKKQVDEYRALYLREGQKLLGVLFRGTDYLRAFGHPIQPSLDEMIMTVKNKLVEWGEDFDFIYLCTEVEEAVLRFEKEFAEKVIVPPQKRVDKDYKGILAEYKFDRDNDTYRRGADYWAALVILSECNSLIAGSCSGTSVALGLNNSQYEYTYIFSLGVNGIN